MLTGLKPYMLSRANLERTSIAPVKPPESVGTKKIATERPKEAIAPKRTTINVPPLPTRRNEDEKTKEKDNDGNKTGDDGDNDGNKTEDKEGETTTPKENGAVASACLIPSHGDTLFWCWFIMHHGLTAYDFKCMVPQQILLHEKNEKLNAVTRVQQHRDLLRAHHLSPVSDLESNLAYDSTLSLKTFVALCLSHGINVMVIQGRKVFSLVSPSSSETHVVRSFSSTQFGVELNVSVARQAELSDATRYAQLSSWDGQLKSMGAYKLGDLQQLCQLFGIDAQDEKNKKRTKPQLYNLLAQVY